MGCGYLGLRNSNTRHGYHSRRGINAQRRPATLTGFYVLVCWRVEWYGSGSGSPDVQHSSPKVSGMLHGVDQVAGQWVLSSGNIDELCTLQLCRCRCRTTLHPARNTPPEYARLTIGVRKWRVVAVALTGASCQSVRSLAAVARESQNVLSSFSARKLVILSGDE